MICLEAYWDNLYRTYGSGLGSRGEYRNWKWQIIDRFSPDMKSVIDVGCGDITFWNGHKFPAKYTGIDFSSVIISRNRKLCPDQTFIEADAQDRLQISADTVLCLDLVFHIMREEVLIKIIENLRDYTLKTLYINGWNFEPDEYDETYQKYWNLDQYVHDLDMKCREITIPGTLAYNMYILTNI